MILENDLVFIEVRKKGFTIERIAAKKDGELFDFLLRFDKQSSYEENDIFLNAFVGPVAGRIEAGEVDFEGKKVKLSVNDNNNYIHGNDETWANLIFDFKLEEDDISKALIGTATQYNKELDCTYKIEITITIFNTKRRVINFHYKVTSDKKTICNPTQHLYWKLPSEESVFDQNIKMYSNYFWKLNKTFNPEKKTYWYLNSENSVKEIMKKIGDDQTNMVNQGIDHPISLITSSRISLVSKIAEIGLIMDSSLNDLVIYTHNWPSKHKLLNSGEKNQAICFEYQHPPTSKKNPNYRQIIIDPNNPYEENTSYELKISNRV
ncbi:hypothetical protein [Mycoplasma todarodis]|uniref:Aldose 1-epimerase n=1 Tax=Mycoplasma todarodis TaxID=1937191 RepID=A0A4R0XV56_9MOLU|nr:hypothetical protein [Mycoplasma todarodis]TCG11599.1 hypothetical protein C4B25_01300 [Mycoplasma todarodis]